MQLSLIPISVGLLLEEYGRNLYRRRIPISRYRQFLLGAAELYKFLRPGLSDAWGVVRVWQAHEPDQLTAPPRAALASICVCSLALGVEEICSIFVAHLLRNAKGH